MPSLQDSAWSSSSFTTTIPAGTQHQNDVVSTSMRRDDVASTLIRRHFNVVCLLGYVVHPRVATRLSKSHPLIFIQIHTAAGYYKCSFFPLAIVQWNMLPPNITLLPDLESFRLAISSLTYFPVSILYKSIAGRYRPVRIADGPTTARFRFIKNASWVQALFLPFILAFCLHRTFNLLTFHLYCFELSLTFPAMTPGLSTPDTCT